MTEEDRLQRRLARSDAVGQLDCYHDYWIGTDGASRTCTMFSGTGQQVIGRGVDADAARADALRLAHERFGR